MSVKNGYKLVEVYEYQATKYDPQTGNGDHFVQNINTFQKLKAEASGYQSWVQCPADKDGYISEFDASEGIQLDKNAIGYNPAKRGLAKLCLHSMWGKLRERNDRIPTKMICNQQELCRLKSRPLCSKEMT